MNPWMWLLWILAASIVATIVIALIVGITRQIRGNTIRTHTHYSLRNDDYR